jgi:hypothetical protein
MASPPLATLSTADRKDLDKVRITVLFVCVGQCFGCGSAFDPHSMGSWIRIRIANADLDDLDLEGGKPAQKRRKVKPEDQKKYIKISTGIFYAVIF